LHSALADVKIALMKKTVMVWGCTLLFGIALQTGMATAQSATTTKSSTAPAAKSATSSSATKKGTGATAKKKTSAAGPAQPGIALSDEKSKVSYAIGLNMGHSMRQQSVDVDPAVLEQGLKDGLDQSSKPLMTDDEARATMMQFQTEMRAKMEEKRKEAGEASKKAGDAFLAANKNKEGVITLPSGLQYKVLTQGTGAKPAASDTVTCNYKGTLVDGTEFDSSYKRGEPANFPVGGVIKGWTEALQLMPVGSKWQLFIPPNLAYGEQGAGADIPPNSTLIFEIELISIQAKK
jgi:FKBP-type peptidyl-prolyl cis-trans isomerase FklB